MRIIRQRAHPRAGLVGNPSDGYHGKTISIIVRNFHAEVTLYEWERIELLLSQEDHSRFDSISSLVRDVELHGYYGGIRLVKATIKKFADYCTRQVEAGHSEYELSDEKFAIRYESNIPRQVGMAGSSAIVVATLRALMEFYHIGIPKRVLPSLALSVEKDELRIGAGLQDRVIQVYEGLVYMDFSKDGMEQVFGYECGHYEPLDPALLPPLYLAYTREQSEPTEAFHNPLRERYEAGDPVIHDAMREFASYAAEGREAIIGRDWARLSELMNKNFDKRRSLFQLAPQHIQMVERARSVGASAKYSGSGGAIIGVYHDEAMFQALQRELGEIECEVFKPAILPEAAG